MLNPLENVLILYNDDCLIASIKIQFHFSQKLREMISYDHHFDTLKSKEFYHLCQCLIKICQNYFCSSFLFFYSEANLGKNLLNNSFKELKKEQNAESYELHHREENLVMQYNNPARMLKMTPSPPEPTEADVASWTPLAQKAFEFRKAWIEKFT